ncbi:hypothetical protein AAG570_013267 [Ranatra chinensis]|uniref:Uncharacterized protein n=1 Tax=Ranatra chinensis TaxID=642074 RepID=A0ABD0YGR8_9HEMI
MICCYQGWDITFDLPKLVSCAVDQWTLEGGGCAQPDVTNVGSNLILAELINIGDSDSLYLEWKPSNVSLIDCRAVMPSSKQIPLKPDQQEDGVKYLGDGLDNGSCGAQILHLEPKHKGNWSLRAVDFNNVKAVKNYTVNIGYMCLSFSGGLTVSIIPTPTAIPPPRWPSAVASKKAPLPPQVDFCQKVSSGPLTINLPGGHSVFGLHPPHPAPNRGGVLSITANQSSWGSSDDVALVGRSLDASAHGPLLPSRLCRTRDSPTRAGSSRRSSTASGALAVCAPPSGSASTDGDHRADGPAPVCSSSSVALVHERSINRTITVIDSTTEYIKCGPDESVYCELSSPKMELNVFDKACTLSVSVNKEKHEGVWTCRYALEGYTTLLSSTIQLYVEATMAKRKAAASVETSPATPQVPLSNSFELLANAPEIIPDVPKKEFVPPIVLNVRHLYVQRNVSRKSPKKVERVPAATVPPITNNRRAPAKKVTEGLSFSEVLGGTDKSTRPAQELLFTPERLTYVPSHGKGSQSTLDLVLANSAKCISSISTLTEGGSDHLPVYFELWGTPQTQLKEPRFDFRKTDWDVFRCELNNVIPTVKPPLGTATDIDTAVVNFTEKITAAIRASTPAIIPKPQKLRLPEEILDLIHDKNKVRRLWQEHRLVEDKRAYNRLHEEVRSRISQWRSSRWDELLRNVSPQDNSLSKLTRRLNRQGAWTTPTLRTETTTATTDLEKAELLAQHFAAINNNSVNRGNDSFNEKVEAEVRRLITGRTNTQTQDASEVEPHNTTISSDVGYNETGTEMNIFCNAIQERMVHPFCLVVTPDGTELNLGAGRGTHRYRYYGRAAAHCGVTIPKPLGPQEYGSWLCSLRSTSNTPTYYGGYVLIKRDPSGK